MDKIETDHFIPQPTFL